MFGFLKRKKQVPEYISKGVDILVDKRVENNLTSKVNSTEYMVRIQERNNPNCITYLMDKCVPAITFPTEMAAAEAISKYLNEIKEEYSLPEFAYRIKVKGENVIKTTDKHETIECTKIVNTTIITKFTEEECETAAKSLEDRLLHEDLRIANENLARADLRKLF